MNELEHSDDFLARWLNNELSEEELKDFEASPDFKAFQRIADETAKFKLEPFDSKKAFENIKNKRAAQGRPKARIYNLQRWAVAATILICFAAASIFFIQQQSTTIEYATMATERNSYTLPDGSTVILNAESKIIFDEATWEEERKIGLSGEAFFSVIKGSPFTVETDLGSVRVLGTEFNVSARNDILDAACYSGRIAVSVDTLQKELSPGNALRYEKGIDVKERTFEDMEAPTWVSGISSFENVSLDFVLDELVRQFEIDIESTVEFDSLIYTGSFPNNNINAAIKLVLDPFELDYNYNAQDKTLYISNSP